MHLHRDGFLELSKLLDLEHEVTTVDILHDKVESVHGLEAGVELDKERWLLWQCKHPFLHHRTLHVVILDYYVFLEYFYRVQLIRSFPLCKHNLHISKKIHIKKNIYIGNFISMYKS